MKNIVFFVRHFTERGTEVAIYDYAQYNEEILGNKSYICCFTEQKQQQIGYPNERISYSKFQSRFPIIELNDISEMTNVINTYNINYFYTLTAGGKGDIYQFENKHIWQKCKTIKHCVFNTTGPEGDFYIGISKCLNDTFKTNIPVLPHMVSLPYHNENLRQELNIPNDAIVYGRYGGYDDFSLSFVRDAIIESTENAYFLFMNTRKFCEHPRVIHLNRNLDLNYKTKFINSCDVMIHARDIGETFGLSIAEFSIMNKPIITCKCGEIEHINILGDRAIIYNNKEELIHIFNNIETIIHSRTDWNAYTNYSPEKIMKLFDTMIFSSTNLCNLVDNTLTDKNTTHSYINLYEQLLNSKKETAKYVLEIGLGDFQEKNGGSIKLWKDYFLNATIFGLDILDNTRIIDELKSDSRVVLYTSTDAYNETFFQNTFLDKNIKCDFMLDDGPQTLESMVQFIKLYSQIMADDGILIIEDVQSMGWIDTLKNTVPEYLKQYIEVYDLRQNKNRYDDIVFVINKNR